MGGLSIEYVAGKEGGACGKRVPVARGKVFPAGQGVEQMMLAPGFAAGFPVSGGGVPHRKGARRIVVVAARPQQNMAMGGYLTYSVLELGEVAMPQRSTDGPIGFAVVASPDSPACAPRAGGVFCSGAL